MTSEIKLPSVKEEVKKFLDINQAKFRGKTIVDFPAGNGVTSDLIRKIGAIPLAFDLFPEYFVFPDLECKRANINNGLPLEDAAVDAVICQEGIEHFTDQLLALKECNRILKTGGILLITTPNYSNIRARLSYFLMESERFNSLMPPNEFDSVWLSNQEISQDLYFGHIFLIGIQKLRTLAKIAGFSIVKIHFSHVKHTSLILFPFVYPFIFLSNWITYKKNIKKTAARNNPAMLKTYKEIFQIGINPKILLDGTLMVEFEKKFESSQVAKHLQGVYSEFGTT